MHGVERRTRHPGRKRQPDRLVFQGVLFVLHTGISWEQLPQGLGFGSRMTCWRHLVEAGSVDRPGRCSDCWRRAARGGHSLDVGLFRRCGPLRY